MSRTFILLKIKDLSSFSRSCLSCPLCCLILLHRDLQSDTNCHNYGNSVGNSVGNSEGVYQKYLGTLPCIKDISTMTLVIYNI